MENFNRKPNTKCCVCETPIYRRPSNLKKTNGKAYCGQDCYGISCRKTKPCVVCGNEILASKHSKTCSKECFDSYLKSSSRNFSTGRKPGLSVKWGTRSFRKRILEERRNCCEVCGYDKIPVLTIHHIVERYLGGDDSNSNLLVLCRNCHSEVHTGSLNKTSESFSKLLEENATKWS